MTLDFEVFQYPFFFEPEPVDPVAYLCWPIKKFMTGKQVKHRRGYFASVLTCRCPRCREGKLFQNPLSISLKKNLQMNKVCPVCGQPTEIEIGFYYGTSYV